MAASLRLTRDITSRRIAEETLPWWAVTAAVVLPLALVTGWIVADAAQPARYSPVRQTVSVTAGYGGQHRWIMTAALTVIGLAYLVAAAGLRLFPAAARLGLVASGVAGLAIVLSPEPAHGTTPRHLAWTAFGELSLALWPLLAATARHIVPLRWSIVAGSVSVALLVWLVVQVNDGHHLGLAERVTATLQTAWPAVVALAARRVRPSPRPAGSPRG